MASGSADASQTDYFQEIGKFVVTFSQMEFWLKWRICDIFGTRHRQAQILLESMDLYKLIEAFERIVNDEEIPFDDPQSKGLIAGIETSPEKPLLEASQKNKWNKIICNIRQLNDKRVIIAHGTWLPGYTTFDNPSVALVAKKTKRQSKTLEIASHFPSLDLIRGAVQMAESIIYDMSAI